MQEDERRNLGLKFTAFRAKLAKEDDDSVIQSTAHSKIVGGKCTHTECVMESGCSFPITSTAVAEALGVEVKPLTKKLEIIDASDRVMEIIGTIRMFIDNRVLGGRKLVEAAVVKSNKKETLISLDLLKKWDLIHDSFPHQTVSDYVESRKNNCFKAYSPAYDFHSSLYEENRQLRKLIFKCNKLREDLMGRWTIL